MENSSIGQPRILVVDDEPRMCESIRALLSVRNYDVCTAFSGNDALELLHRKSFDVALLDLMLPGMDGYQIMERIHENDPELPVIMITGKPSVKVAVNALKRGAYDFIRKPFEYDELLMTLKNALSQRTLKREKADMRGRLARTEERYRLLVENSPDIIYTLDEEGRFTFVSNAISGILGTKSADILGSHYSALVHENDLDKARWCFNERRTGDRAASGVEFRLAAKKNGGKSEGNGFNLRTVELKAMGMYESNASDEKKRFLGTHGVARDVTERKNLEAKLKQAERMESLGTLAGGIAHDFNNLLMGIQGNASLALLEMPDGHPIVERLRNIEKLVQSGAELTMRLLGFARGGKYQVKPTDIRELVSRGLSLFRRTKKEITVFEEYCETPWAVEVDRSQMDQVFLNLFVNAWQAMPGGGELHVAIRNVLLSRDEVAPHELQPGKYVVVSVKDTGVGMDKATRKRIFEPFFTTRGKGGGSGLGLASAYGIVKNHGGLIDVQSEKGNGAMFSVYLPCCEKQASRGVEAKEKVVKGCGRLLIVDDEDAVLTVGKEMLEALGYRVFTARSGEEAIDLVRSTKSLPDLVILDMIMPGMSGAETFEALKAFCPGIKVLLSSGYCAEAPAAETLRQGCEDFIQKPFTLGDLSLKVCRILDKSNL